MDRSTDHLRGVLLFFFTTDKTGIMRGVVGGLGWWRWWLDLVFHDINLAGFSWCKA